ncbi:class I SAM-dependent methyltransferase [uncultured Jatrophihabitans sp.]|uniref:class I SAM-dependent methyltransferase n=1 Tax=uncultured Jatrophihabitans sp. TaxID=1610747 RepID=UPI0035C96BFD
MRRHDFLHALHQRLRPRTYVETGIYKGESLVLSHVPSIGIDPEFAVETELRADVHLARTSSDEFFARPHPVAHLPEDVIDLAFIDGMHLSEYALRDFLAIERFTAPTSVLVFDDMLPRSVDEAARYRHTNAWTGDVFKAAQALRDLRPDLVVIEVNTTTTGVVVVLLPDARNGGVLAGYDDWLEVAVSPDPQDVPTEVLTRSRAVDPDRLVECSGWAELARLRDSSRKVDYADRIRHSFREFITG